MISTISNIIIPSDNLLRPYKKEKFIFLKGDRDRHLSSSSIEWSTSLYQVWIESGMEDLVISQLSLKIISFCGSLDCYISLKNFPKDICNKLEYDRRHIIAAVNILSKEKKERILPLLKDMLETIKKFLLEKENSRIKEDV